MASPQARGFPARGLLRCIDAYQHLFRDRPSPCRYVPSCSQYAREAVESHGAGRGSWLAARRVCRCHPWGGHGYDPVPGREGAPEREGAPC
jgi:uncharacterized protein